ncbi:methyl-accepting chemotaxis protein [Halorussus sp. MSC15.2]|uniref:methyl-accepting chemotaxis protein n=1 Tax=Halorussus sp. MSC15.2 TaxID=2283638 RepID=UPI0013D0700C|nr:methyl-accepting chemotaxis protein [Halorussus sp. MSC15.2]NEU56575.1 HAMP domain-containing protein [Halorussus sp. MSC15.2]
MNDERNSEATSGQEPPESGSRSLWSRFVAAVTPAAVRRRYAAKFTLSITLIILVVGAAGATTYVDARNMARDEATAQVESTVTLQADSLSDWIEGLRTQTRTLSAQRSLAAGNRTEKRQRLEAAMNRSSNGVRAMYLVDAERGVVTASTKPNVEGWSLDRVEMPWSNASVASSFESGDDVWTSHAYVSKTTTWTDEDSPWYTDDHKFMAVASPVAGADGTYLVVAGGIDDRVRQLHQPATNQTTWIVDTDGETVLKSGATNISSSGVLAGTGDLAETSSDGSATGDGSAAVETTDGSGTSPVEVRERGDYVLAYSPIEGTDWVAATVIRKQEAYALSTAVGRNIGLLVGASLLSLLGVGLVLGRRTVRPLADLRERSQRMEQGELDVSLETHREDEFGRLYAAFASMRDELRDQIETTERLNRHLERKADEYHGVMAECADGDLTRRLDPESDNEAMTAIAEAFNEMMGDIEATMADLNAFADEVATASEVVTASSEEVYSASEQVTDSIQEISAGADSQNEQLQTVADELSGLSATTEEIAASSNQVAELAAETAETGREGREAARDAIRGLDRIETESDEAVAQIERLEDEVTEVDELIEFIREIATQTNMLALNASIEVSRSSTGGGNPEGFAAVANKIKDLAEEAKIAAEDIEQRLDRIKTQTERTGEEVQSASDQISEHTDSISHAVEALEEIADYAQETNTGIQSISEATEEQADTTEEVVTMFDEVAGISEATTEEASNVAAAAEEQTSALTAVSRSANDLTAQAERLSAALDRFETDASAERSLADETDLPSESGEGLSLPADPDDPDAVLDGIDHAGDSDADDGGAGEDGAGDTGGEDGSGDAGEDGETDREGSGGEVGDGADERPVESPDST